MFDTCGFATKIFVGPGHGSTSRIPRIGNMISGVDDTATRQAQAIRSELGRRALKEFGSYPAIAAAMDVPKKSVYRYLTEEGKDGVMPPLPFVVQLVELLHAHGGDDFAAFWAAATKGVH